MLRIRGKLEQARFNRMGPEDTKKIAQALAPGKEIDDINDYDTSYSIPGKMRFRVNIFKQRGTFAVILRVIPGNPIVLMLPPQATQQDILELKAQYGLVIAPYPLADDKAFAPEAERVMDSVIELVRSIRNIRAQYKVKASKWIEARVYAGELLSSLVPQTNMMEILAKARPLTILDRQKREPAKDTDLVLVLKEAELVVPLAGMVDRLAEEQRLMKESREIKERMAQLEARLSDKAFLSKAPSQVVEKEKQKLSMLGDKLNRLNQELSQLNSSSVDS